MDKMKLCLNGEAIAQWEEIPSEYDDFIKLQGLLFHLYGFDRSDIEHAMNSFPIVRRKDEAAHGYYKTKEDILAAFDNLTGRDEERKERVATNQRVI